MLEIERCLSSKLIDCEGEIADSVVFYAVEEPLVKVTKIIQGESKTRLVFIRVKAL